MDTFAFLNPAMIYEPWDIEQLILKHAPAKYKPLAKFIKRVLHQENFARFLESCKDLQGQEFIREIIRFFDVRIKYCGVENIPAGGRYIFATNHPLGGLDGVCLLGLIYSYFGDVKAVVNELLLYIENLRPVFTGVNIYGRFKRPQLMALDELFRSDSNILVFPAGVVSIFRQGKIQDLPWHKSFLVKAVEYQRDIVPVYSDARNSLFFYLVATLRRLFRINISYESFLLPNEMFRFKGKEIRFYFGKPISWTVFSKERSVQDWVGEIRKIVENLRQPSQPMKAFLYTQIKPSNGIRLP